MKSSALCPAVCVVSVLLLGISTSTHAQLAPAGATLIQSPTGVYYAFYSDSVHRYRSVFYYVNYNTGDFDMINPTVSVSGSFSGTSATTARSLSGQIQSDSITLTYNAVTVSGAKESLYGPTRQFAGQWLGTVSDPNNGIGFGELYISSHNECFVFYLQNFNYNVGIGSISSTGFASVRLLNGVTISGAFAPANGGASGTFSYSTGGRNSYSLTKAVTPRLVNISTRGFVGAGEQVLIGGFIISDGGKTVFIDAKGPSLAGIGVANPVHATRIDLHRGSQVIASNNGWRNNANVAEIMASGLAPTDDRESALQVALEPGNYTVIVSSGDGSTGVGLVEVYGVGSAVGY